MPHILLCRFAPKNYCVNVFGLIVTRDMRGVDRRLINHELIHTRQQKELLFLPFYIIYGLEFILRLLRTGNVKKAYLAISFEREAYQNADNLNYLLHRPVFAQWRKKRRT